MVQRAPRMKYLPKQVSKDTWEVQKSPYVRPQHATGKRAFTEQGQPEAHIKHKVDALQLSYETIWRILCKELIWMAYMLHLP